MTKSRLLRKHANAFTVHLMAPNPDDARVIASLPSRVVSKHKAKHHRKEVRHDCERKRWQSGFRGEVPSTGKEMLNYVPTFRVKDGTKWETGKAWLRRGVR